jgi:hypothetical protein
LTLIACFIAGVVYFGLIWPYIKIRRMLCQISSAFKLYLT